MCNLFIIYDPTVDKISSLRRQTLSRKEIAQYKWSTIDTRYKDPYDLDKYLNRYMEHPSIILYTN